MMQVDHGTGAPPMGGRSVQLVLQALGAAISVALVVGVGVWGWKLAVRDVSGVPVVRALEGPMRVAPEDPGGMRAAYQGLAVNAVAAGTLDDQPQRLQLAPPPPSLDALPEAPVAQRPAPPEAAAQVTDAVLRRPDSGDRIEVIPASIPGVARSPLPRARPAGDLLAEAAAMAVLQAFAPGSALELDPDSLPPGTRLVQLGAHDDPAAAQAEWETLSRRFPALMDGKGRVVQAAEAGGRTFYRLRAQGFSDEASARRFCAVLLHENLTCIPVLIR